MKDTILSAFLGAFFAFLFVRLAEALTKIYNRQVRNYNALIRLEYYCMEQVDTVANNIKIIEDYILTVEPALEKNLPLVYVNKLHKSPFIDDVLLDLSNIDLINKVLSLKVLIGRVNNDVDMLNELSESHRTLFIQKTIDYVTYKGNMVSLIGKLKEIKKFIANLDSQMEEVGACVRIVARDSKPLLTRLIHFICCKKAFSDQFRKNVSEEIKKIKEERKSVSEASRAEIDKIRSSK